MQKTWGRYSVFACSVLAIVFVLGFLTNIAYAQEKTFNAEHYMLDNGLEVVVIPNHRAPVVTHMVWYKVGAADEPEGKSGIAHFLEHLMFKGSDGLEPGEFSEIVRSLGGNDNAFTSQDYTAYFQSVAAEHLETVMRMEAGRMRGLNPPMEEFESEHKVILEERSQRMDNNPGSRLGEKLSEALHQAHPYGDPVIGWRDEMEALTWEDAKAFYDDWYEPNNAILVVSGDVSGEEVLALAQKIYGGFGRAPVPERKRLKSFEKEPQDLVTLEDKAVRQPTVQHGYIVPSYRQNPADSLALQVLEEIVGSGSSSRLYKSLVIEQKLASSAGLSYRSDAWDSTELWLSGAPLPGIEPEALEQALIAEVAKVIENGVSDEEVKDAVTRLQSEAIYARDSLSGPAMIFGYALATGSMMDDIEYWPENIAQVTPKQVQDVARKYLSPEGEGFVRDISGYLLPTSTEEGSESE